jgi:hypothetical protein
MMKKAQRERWAVRLRASTLLEAPAERRDDLLRIKHVSSSARHETDSGPILFREYRGGVIIWYGKAIVAEPVV